MQQRAPRRHTDAHLTAEVLDWQAASACLRIEAICVSADFSPGALVLNSGNCGFVLAVFRTAEG